MNRRSPVVGRNFEERLRQLQQEVDDLARMATRSSPLITSCVGKMKDFYRTGSPCQRAQMRAWMRRVLSGEDGNT